MEEVKVAPGLFVTANEKDFEEVYRIGKCIGSGSESQVHICTHRQTGVRRAARIFRKGAYQGQKEERMINEIEILKTLDHPNILRIYEFFEDRKHYYIVMEYCKGGSLTQEIERRQHFTEVQAALVIAQVISAVGYLHERGILHGELTTENILLEERSKDLTIKIVDFGNSGRRTQTSKKIKTNEIQFLAPETFDGDLTSKADVWSVGVILFILLTGLPVVLGESEHDITENLTLFNLNLNEADWTLVSQGGRELVEQMLSPMGKRPTAKQASRNQWLKDKAQSQMSIQVLEQVMENIRNFTVGNKLRDIVSTFIVTHCLTTNDVKEIRDSFRKFDTNNDGKLSRQELLVQYKIVVGETQAEEEVGRIFAAVDTDNSGFIDYTEFLKACIDPKKLLSKRNIAAAFGAFDKDGSGTITPSELKAILDAEGLVDDDSWGEVVEQIDANGDGVIDLDEFEEIVSKTDAKA
jgi:calcium-dependent protein kinase